MEAKTKRLCELSFWLMLLLSPFLDMINGIWSYLRAGGTGGMLSTLDLPESSTLGPSLTVRLVFLALMVLYLLLVRHRRAIIMFAAIVCTWLMTFVYALVRGGDFSIFTEIEYIVRFCYCLVCLVAGERILRASAERLDVRSTLDKVLCAAALCAALGVLIPYILGMGFYTYADPLGYRGSRGFYYAGNDITVVMMLILPILLCSWMEKKGKNGLWDYLRAAAAALCVVAMIIIGTKTSFVTLAVIGGVMLVYAIIDVFRAKSPAMLLRFAAVGILAAMAFFLISLTEADPAATVKDTVAATGQYAETGDAQQVVLSGRTTYLIMAWHDFLETLPLSAFVGVGRAGQFKIIEMDLFEVFLYYGVLGTASMLWLYLSQGIRVVIDFFRAFSFRGLACCVALGLCVGFLTLAGHVLFSVTAGFYFAFMICYARLFCSREGMDARII